MSRPLKKLWVLTAMVLLTLALGATAAYADTQGAATVTASALNMRSEASTSGSIVTCLPRGTAVVVTGSSGDWYQVAYRGSAGYMSGDYLTISDSADGSFGDGTITGNDVRVRSGPGTSYSVLGYVNSGKTFSITGVDGNWCRISYDGENAYVSSTYVRFASGGSSSSSSGGSNGPAAGGTGTINATDVRFRSGPGTSHSILGTYSTGTTMTVTGEQGDWYKVNYNGQDGYVYKTYLTLGTSSSTGETVTDVPDITASVISPVHMRSGPATSYTSQRVLGTGTNVTITGSTDKWYRVTYNGAEGYIFKTYLTTETSGSAPAASSEGQRLVEETKKYLGVSYVYGGTSPSGFDCSGFVYYVYRQCGYTITRTATAQNSVGSYVSRDNLQPGDIIIFYNSAKSAIGHSGIYIGNGQFIHASSGSGKVVITNLSASYYNTHYYSARRVVS